MGAAISAERWAAARALYEGYPRSYRVLGAAMAIDPGTVYRHATRDGWTKAAANAAPSASLGIDEVAQGFAALCGEDDAAFLNWMDKVARKAASDGMPDKKHVDAMSAVLRLRREIRKEQETLATERAIEKDEDGTLAERLRRIDDRIVELAEAHAAWLVSGTRGGDAG